MKHITIRDPHTERDPRKCTTAEKLLSGKVCNYSSYIRASVDLTSVKHGMGLKTVYLHLEFWFS